VKGVVEIVAIDRRDGLDTLREIADADSALRLARDASDVNPLDGKGLGN